MANVTRNIGLSLGADICWPGCYEEIVKRLNLSVPHGGDTLEFHVERVTVEPYFLRQPVRYDVVLDTVGTLSPSTGRRLLTDGGVLLLAAATLAETVVPRRRVKAGVAPERAEDVAFLLERVAKGELGVVVDEVVALDGIVAAYRRVDSGRKVGNLVLRP